MIGLLIEWQVRKRLRQGPAEAAALGLKAVASLVRVLDDPAFRGPAAKALLLLGAGSRPALYRCLTRGRGIRPILNVLGRLRPRASVERMVPFLGNHPIGVRREAARAIARQGGRLAYKVMCEALLAPENDPAIRRTACDWLMRSTHPRAIRCLVILASKADSQLAALACARILKLGYLSAGPLVEALRTPDKAIRATVSELFDGMNDADSMVILSKGLEEDDDRIWPVLRDAFGRKGALAEPILLPLAGHPDKRVRRVVLELLAGWDAVRLPTEPNGSTSREPHLVERSEVPDSPQGVGLV